METDDRSCAVGDDEHSDDQLIERSSHESNDNPGDINFQPGRFQGSPALDLQYESYPVESSPEFDLGSSPDFGHTSELENEKSLDALRRRRAEDFAAKISRRRQGRNNGQQGQTTGTFIMSMPLPPKLQGDWLFSTMEESAPEVRAAKASASWLRRKVFNANITSYNSVRETYRLHYLSQVDSSIQRSGQQWYLQLMELIVNLKSLFRAHRPSLPVDVQLSLYFLFDFLMEAWACILYLAEMQYNITNFFSIDFSPRWIFVARSDAIFNIAFYLSIFSLISWIISLIMSPSKKKVLFSVETLIILLSSIPFIVLTQAVYGHYIYVPYFLRALLGVKKLKRVIRLRSRLFFIHPVTEQLIILISTVIMLLYSALCIMNYVELYFQPNTIDGNPNYRFLGLVDSLYFIVITITTVGYGDLVPTSIPGRLVIILLILVSLAVVPSLVTSVVDTLTLQRAGGGTYVRGKAPFVIVCGLFDTVPRVSDVLNAFLHSEKKHEDLQVVFVSRNDPPLGVKVLVTNSFYQSRVTFLTGSMLDSSDLKRAQAEYASALFIVGSRTAPDPRQEDEMNTLRAWTCDEYAPLTPLYVYNLTPEAETYQEHTTTATVCVETLQQALMAFSCLYKGSGTFMINLLNQSQPYDRYSEPWMAQYGDGSGNEIYSAPLNPIFIGKTFADVSCFIYQHFQTILFGVRIYVAENQAYHIALNPAQNYVFKERDECLHISQDQQSVEAIKKLKTTHLDDYLERSRQSVTGRIVPLSRRCTKIMFKSSESQEDLTQLLDQPVHKGRLETPYSDSKTPLCYLLKTPARKLNDVVLQDARLKRNHVLVCTSTFDLFKFVCTLRGAHLKPDELYEVVFLCDRLPTEDEFEILRHFPGLYFMVGDCRKKQHLIKAGISGAEKVVIMKYAPASVDDKESLEADFADSAAIMVSHLVYNMFHGLERSKFVLVELEKRNHIKFLRPGARIGSAKRGLKSSRVGEDVMPWDFLYAPTFAGGRVLVSTMLDSILFQSFFNPSIVDVFELLLGIRSKKEADLDHQLKIPSSFLYSIDLPRDYAGRAFGDLYQDLLLVHGMVAVGLYRSNDDSFYKNRLSYVFTNPLPSVLLRASDLVFVIGPHD